jgi:AraC-like DNA-binding protein/CheY-like chemotaxis protein
MHLGHRPANGDGRCGHRVLILDSDPGIGKVLAVALRQEAQVEWAASGTAGVLIAAEQQVDLVIAKSPLPDVPLKDLLRLLRLLQPDLPLAVIGGQTPNCREENDGGVAWFPSPPEVDRIRAWCVHRLGHQVPKDTAQVVPGPQQEIRHRDSAIVQGVLEFVERRRHVGTPLGVIARAAGVSRSHLCRVFRRATGVPLKRFLMGRRLQEAKSRLLEPGATIHQIACQTGFRDASHFDRVFRRWEGQTPSRYRRQAIQRAARTGNPCAGVRQARAPRLPSD